MVVKIDNSSSSFCPATKYGKERIPNLSDDSYDRCIEVKKSWATDTQETKTHMMRRLEQPSSFPYSFKFLKGHVKMVCLRQHLSSHASFLLHESCNTKSSN